MPCEVSRFEESDRDIRFRFGSWRTVSAGSDTVEEVSGDESELILLWCGNLNLWYSLDSRLSQQTPCGADSERDDDYGIGNQVSLLPPAVSVCIYEAITATQEFQFPD